MRSGDTTGGRIVMRRVALGAAGVALAAVAVAFSVPYLALPVNHGAFMIPGLEGKVRIQFDEVGAPHVTAATRDDAYAALGYVTARDRLFQMDLFRRKTAGTLAEVLGKDLIESDRWSRTMGFYQLAHEILTRLPREQRRVLNSYTAGVNQAMRDSRIWPWEFLLLSYRPEPWRPEDSILVALNFAEMSYSVAQERMSTVMRKALPATVVTFLTPESDCYNERLAPWNPARCGDGALMPLEMEALLPNAQDKSEPIRAGGRRISRGSNAWIISGRRTSDGRTILANDMHLSLDVPNIWYQAHLAYGHYRMEGLTCPGLPLVISGSNGHVAWGMTNLDGDLADLVRLRKVDGDVSRYATPAGAETFQFRRESIAVRGGEEVLFEVKDTIWGPVLPQRLLGEDVALRWTMLDPSATNLDLMQMDRVVDVRTAIDVLQGSGVPPLNALVAGPDGGIGWTIMGKLPKRRGFNGRFAEFWDDGGIGWDGYLSKEETPAVIDPPAGFIVSANQRMLPRDEFPMEIGHDYSGGFRAWRIAERLVQIPVVDEAGMASIQLDNSGKFYEPYRTLALAALGRSSRNSKQTDGIRKALERWDGRAARESVGFPLIFGFRNALVENILTLVVARCRSLDPAFEFNWSTIDDPVLRIASRLTNGSDADRDRDWNDRIVGILSKEATRIESEAGESLSGPLQWGEMNRAEIRHPLSRALPILSSILDMPRSELSGCAQCVNFYYAEGGRSLGANARIVVAPGHEEDSLITMAGGQSGEASSAYYADQQLDWVAGRFRGFRRRMADGELLLEPVFGSKQSLTDTR